MLFTFFGKLAMYDHVYLVPQQGETAPIGGWVWSDQKVYQPLVDFIITHKLPQRLNSNEVAKCDKQAFRQAHPNGLLLPNGRIDLPKPDYRDLEDLYFEDSYPEEWDV